MLAKIESMSYITNNKPKDLLLKRREASLKKKIKERKKVLGRKIHDKIEEKNKLSAKIDEVKKQQADQKGEEADKKENNKKEDRPKHPLTIKIEKMKEDID